MGWITVIAYILAIWKLGDFIGWKKIFNGLMEFREKYGGKGEPEDQNKQATKCQKCGKNSKGKPLCLTCWKKEHKK